MAWLDVVWPGVVWSDRVRAGIGDDSDDDGDDDGEADDDDDDDDAYDDDDDDDDDYDDDGGGDDDDAGDDDDDDRAGDEGDAFLSCDTLIVIPLRNLWAKCPPPLIGKSIRTSNPEVVLLSPPSHTWLEANGIK